MRVCTGVKKEGNERLLCQRVNENAEKNGICGNEDEKKKKRKEKRRGGVDSNAKRRV